MERASRRRARRAATALWTAIALYVWGFLFLALWYLGLPEVLFRVTR